MLFASKERLDNRRSGIRRDNQIVVILLGSSRFIAIISDDELRTNPWKHTFFSLTNRNQISLPKAVIC